MKLIILTCFLLVASASLAGCDQEPRRGAAAGKVTETPGHGPSSTERDTPGALHTPASDDVKKLSSTSSLEEGGDFEALLESAAAEAEVDLLKIPANDTESAASALESGDKITERQAFVSGPNLNPDRLGFAFPHIHHHLPPIHHPPIPRPPPIPKRRPPPLPPIPDHHHDFPPPDFDFDPPDFFENAGLPPPGDEPFGFGAPFETHEHEHDPFFSPHLDDDFPPHDEHFPHDLDLHSPHDDHFSPPPPPPPPPPPLKPFSEDPIVFPKRPPPHKHPRPAKHPSKHPPPHHTHHHHHHPPPHFSPHLNFITEDSIYRDDVPFKETHNERDRIHPGLTPAGVKGLDPAFISFIKEQTRPYIDSQSRFRFER